MLRVSTKGEYGVRIMVDLARHYGGRPRSLTDIAQAESLPLAYLEQLVKLLRESNPPLVMSTRGAHGGYRLTRSPEHISMGEVVRVLEGPISPMICTTEGEMNQADMSQICGFFDSCKTKYLWARVRDAVAQTLDAITLADLVAESVAGSSEESGVPAHFIALSDIHVLQSPQADRREPLAPPAP
ncbi:MAG TPA: Rrf2 family transcriptional regulator [Ktedonobacteraceae bacterium]|nr:Rrf2 family transcriptional regulator [Ktedonobacteraceae bacterium]